MSEHSEEDEEAGSEGSKSALTQCEACMFVHSSALLSIHSTFYQSRFVAKKRAE